MVYLNNAKSLPENAEWSYLYAIADLYQNYSSSEFDKDNPNAPHPLTDIDVINLLEEKYNIKKIHRNTITNTRKKLEEYFGFSFKSTKNGKYLEKNTFGLNNSSLLIQIAFIVKDSKVMGLTPDIKMILIHFLSSLCASKETKATIENMSNAKYGSYGKDNQFDKFDIIYNAIGKGNNLLLETKAYDTPQEVKPIQVYVENSKMVLLYKIKSNNHGLESISRKIPLEKINKVTIVDNK